MKNWSAYTIPEIKAELKKRTLRVGGKKAELVLRLTTNIENERFEYFPKLPVEIRLNIWKMALPGRRIIRLESSYLGNSISYTIPHLDGIADLLLANKESSEVALNHVRPMRGEAAQPSQSAARGPSFLYHDDIFYFYDYESLRAFSQVSFDPEMKEIKTIAVDVEGFFFYDIMDFDHILELFARFPNLDAVICIEDMRPVKQNKRRNRDDILSYLGIYGDKEPGHNQPPPWMPAYEDVKSNNDDELTELGYLKGLFKEAGKYNKAMESLEKVKLCYAKVV